MTWYDAEHQVLVEVISWAAAAGLGAHAWRLRSALTDYLAVTGRRRAQAVTMRMGLEAALAAAGAARQARSAPRPRLHGGLSTRRVG